MPVYLTDYDIAVLVGEPKTLPHNYRIRLNPRIKRGHREAALPLKSGDNPDFVIIVRQLVENPFDFSVILSYQIPGSTRRLRLRRYNGNSHRHTNKIEKTTFWGFHIHLATERYQDAGLDEDGFAEPTDRYADLQGAIDCLLADCAFALPDGCQMSLL